METAMKTMTDKKRGFCGPGAGVGLCFFAGTPAVRGIHGGVEYLADDCTLDYHLYFLGTGGGLGTADGGKEVWPEAV